MKKFLIEFTSVHLGAVKATYVSTVAGAKRRATRLYRERFCGPWITRIYDSATGKLVASRIGLNPWRNA